MAITDWASTGNEASSNIIGTTQGGTINLGNGFAGVLLDATAGNTISGNYIYYNTDVGIRVQDGAQQQNSYTNNYFYANLAGSIDDDD